MKVQAIRHLDEARDHLLSLLKADWSTLAANKILVIEDAFGRFSLGVWGGRKAQQDLVNLLEKIAPFGSGSIFWAAESEGAFDLLELERSWEESSPIDNEGEYDETLRIIVRHRMLPAWQRLSPTPLWSVDVSSQCPIIGFYSFKGGMGRTTALLAFALERVLANEHVIVVDLDLDAPGLGSVLDSSDRKAPYGVVDYLIELPVLGKRPADLLDYSRNVDLGAHRTSGSLRVFPAGQLDRHYLGKIARLDFETESGQEGDLRHPVEELLLHIREKLQPDWILVDSRTGFSETAGLLLSGICHFHVLFGVDSTQSWEGLTYAIRRLGEERLDRNLPQAEAIMVHAMVPMLPAAQKADLIEGFLERSEDAFQANYYTQDESVRDDRFWYLSDSTSRNSPHHTWPLSYREDLAQSFSVAGLWQVLEDSGEFKAFCRALAARARGEDVLEPEA